VTELFATHLDKLHLGESVARALLAQPVVALPPPASFVGAGIYALYYTGNFPAYLKISEKNVNDAWALPIYVGKAVPLGARRGGYGLGESPGDVLYRRLREHAMSIQQVADLALEDFRCRYLVVDDIWIPLGESLLISMFVPLWNTGSMALGTTIQAQAVIINGAQLGTRST
jgi:Eco29kI restriction endonuclease